MAGEGAVTGARRRGASPMLSYERRPPRHDREPQSCRDPRAPGLGVGRPGRLPSGARGAHRSRGPDALRMRRPLGLSPDAAGGRASRHGRRRRREVLRVARETATPVVARGSGTGLSGGALPLADGILLSMGKFNRILARRSARARGARAARREERADHGSAPPRSASTTPPIPPARSPVPSAATWRRIPAACIASSTASRCTTSRRCARSRSRATRRAGVGRARRAGLRPARGGDRFRGAARAPHRGDGEAAAEAADGAGGHGLVHRAWRAAGEAVARGDRRGHRAGGPRDDGQARHGRRRGLRARRLRPGGARRSCCANPTARPRRWPRKSPRSTEVMRAGRLHGHSRSRRARPSGCKFWSGRKAAFPAVGRISPDYYCIDGSIPRGALAQGAAAHRGALAALRPALRQRLPRGRRQPPPAHPLRRERSRASSRRRRNSRATSSSCASRWAAPSPASTAWASRRSSRCACSSGRRSSRSSTR